MKETVKMITSLLIACVFTVSVYADQTYTQTRTVTTSVGSARVVCSATYHSTGTSIWTAAVNATPVTTMRSVSATKSITSSSETSCTVKSQITMTGTDYSVATSDQSFRFNRS